MAFDDLGHGIAPSTHSGYRTGWRDWKVRATMLQSGLVPCPHVATELRWDVLQEFVDKHDLYELVTLAGVIAYLRWKHSDVSPCRGVLALLFVFLGGGCKR